MKRLFPFLLSLFLLLFFGAVAQAADTDRDGLSDKREKKLKTSPRKADTDRDKLKDGREVKKTRTNPRRADTDGDGVGDGLEVEDGLDPLDADSDDDGTRDIFERKGKITQFTYTSGDPLVTVQTKKKTIFQVRIDEMTFLEGLDRDGDQLLTLQDFQIGDRVEVNLDPENPRRAQTLELQVGGQLEVKGQIVDLNDPSVTLQTKEGQSSFDVDIDTFLRVPDRDGSGNPSFGDLDLGDRVEAYLSEDGSRALALKVKFDDDDYGDDNGYDKPGEMQEAEGRVQSVSGNTVVLEKRGYTKSITVDDQTFFVGPDRDSSGAPGLADIRVGDEAEARLRPGTEVAAGLKFKGEDDDSPEVPPGEIRRELEGPVMAVFLGIPGGPPPTITVARPVGPPAVLIATPQTVFQVPDRNSDGQQKLNDILVGDRVDVKFLLPSSNLLEVELEEADD